MNLKGNFIKEKGKTKNRREISTRFNLGECLFDYFDSFSFLSIGFIALHSMIIKALNRANNKQEYLKRDLSELETAQQQRNGNDGLRKRRSDFTHFRIMEKPRSSKTKISFFFPNAFLKPQHVRHTKRGSGRVADQPISTERGGPSQTAGDSRQKERISNKGGDIVYERACFKVNYFFTHQVRVINFPNVVGDAREQASHHHRRRYPRNTLNIHPFPFHLETVFY